MRTTVDSVIRTMWQEWGKFYEGHILDADPEARLDEHLRILYGRGEIDKERFLQLRLRLHGGLVSETDLSVVHQQAIRLMEARGNYLPQGNPELERALDRLYADRVRVEEASDQLKASMEALRNEVDWIKAQAEGARQDASSALPDETTARAFLQVWQSLLSLSQALDHDLQATEHNLANLKALESEIKAAITKIKLFRSREQLAGLNQQVLGDLLTPG
jgi:predicted Zn-dependent protease